MEMRLVCVSHSPMLGNLPEPSKSEATVISHFEALRQEIAEFDPELVILFGPDHFNGFFFDLMPAFCIGIKGESVGDYNGAKGPILIAEKDSMASLLALNESGFDPAVSYRMQVDHGFEQPMSMLLGGIDKRPVVPMFINCVGAPRPSFRRVREYGAAVGRWAVAQNKRTLVIGSGGLSHDPPVGTLDTASPEQFAFMVSGRSPTAEARRLREERTTNAATEFKAGRTNLLPLNEAWDRRMLELFTSGNFDELEKLSDASITQEGGRGGHEIRTWMAAFAAIAEVGPVDAQVLYYNAIPEWIVGMGMVSARAGTAS